MKAWEIVGCTHNGEIICPECYTRREAAVVADKIEDGDICPIFASKLETDEICGRCGSTISG